MLRSLVVVFVVLVASSPNLVAGVMELEAPDGKIFLLDDQSNMWEIHKSQRGKYLIEEDFPIELGDGRTILIAVDGSWRFIEKAELPPPKPTKLTKAVTDGISRGSNVDVCKVKALNTAAEKMGRKIYASMRKKTVTVNELTTCAKRCRDYTDYLENFRQGQGWEVTVRISLDQDMVLTVIQCAEEAKAKALP